MDDRAAKLALARRKLKDHQEKKLVCIQKDDTCLKSEVDVKIPNKSEQALREDEAQTTHTLQNVESLQNFVSESVQSECFPNINNTNPVTQPDAIENIPKADVNITEILISSKRNLELQVHDLQTKLAQLEQNHDFVVSNYKLCNQKIYDLQNELKDLNDRYLNAANDILIKDKKINELNSVKSSLGEEKSNLIEKLEFTKTVLNAKETENNSLHNQLFDLQNRFDVMQLKLQQLTNGSLTNPQNDKVKTENTEALLHKIASLEQQLNLLQKERDQINIHYEHYVAELNDQLKSVIKRNEELTREVESLSNRENSLIEQISDMEIRIQNFNIHKNTKTEVNINTFSEEINHNLSANVVNQNSSLLQELQDELNKAKDNISILQNRNEELQKQYAESIAQLKTLTEIKEVECTHDNISLSKLNADMESDKVAAQRATEQNKKLKQDLQGLEDAFVKMSKDKLELTEKLAAEKYLNRELTIKLAEVDEKAKDMQIKLKAKDDEMIRIQSNLRDVEKQYEKLVNSEINYSSTSLNAGDPSLPKNRDDEDKPSETNYKSSIEEAEKNCHSLGLQKEDAMLKLQDRFLKIMEEVADLSDEKHRLEHIILQLQNETDTICEYVALYQQQRSLLKRRDEERSAQLKIFQQECGKLKSELEELSGILTIFAEDKELTSYFQTESKRSAMERVMTLLSNLKNNSLIDSKKKDVEFKNFYPCNCCSGKLIDI